jgi:hypothetical protein
MTTIQLALLLLALALGWTMLSRMKDLRRATEAAQADQLGTAARQTHELEALVAERNAELSKWGVAAHPL